MGNFKTPSTNYKQNLIRQKNSYEVEIIFLKILKIKKAMNNTVLGKWYNQQWNLETKKEYSQ